MNRRILFLGVAGLAVGLAAPAGAVTIPSQAPVQDAGALPTTEVKKGGRGRRVGWTRGRGKAIGRKRKFGF